MSNQLVSRESLLQLIEDLTLRNKDISAQRYRLIGERESLIKEIEALREQIRNQEVKDEVFLEKC